MWSQRCFKGSQKVNGYFQRVVGAFQALSRSIGDLRGFSRRSQGDSGKVPEDLRGVSGGPSGFQRGI